MSGFEVDADLVRALADLLNETGLGEIEYETDGRRIRVAVPPPGPVAAPPTVIATPAPAKATPIDADANAQAPSEAAHPGTVTSPMVGTIYLSPTPEDPPFAAVGATIAEGQTLMLVEAMKTFNEIKATRAGTVMSVMVENGQPVEYGEPLAIIS